MHFLNIPHYFSNKNSDSIFIGIILNYRFKLGRIAVFMMLSLPNYELDIQFHVSRLFFVFLSVFQNFLQSSCTLVKFVKYFAIFYYYCK